MAVSAQLTRAHPSDEGPVGVTVEMHYDRHAGNTPPGVWLHDAANVYLGADEAEQIARALIAAATRLRRVEAAS